MRDSSIECFNLCIGAPGEEKLGELQVFGRRWIWGQSYEAGAAPLRLFEWTPMGVTDITTEHASLHRVVAGTPHHVEGLYGILPGVWDAARRTPGGPPCGADAYS